MPTFVAGGDHVAFTLGKLDLTSQGSPANTSVKVYAGTSSGRVELGTFPVTDGSATVDLTVPGSVAPNSPLTVVADPSGTTVGKTTLPTVVSATADPITYGTPGAVRISVDPAQATGPVTVLDGTRQLGSATLNGGSATVTLGATALKPGSHGLTVSYAGDSSNPAASTAVNVKVAKATPALKVSVSPKTVHVDRTRPSVTVRLSAPGHTVRGKVVVRSGGRQYVAALTDGVATVKLQPYRSTGAKQIAVTYLGSSNDKSVATTVQVRVRR